MMGWRFYRLSLSAIHTFLIVLTLLQPHSASLASASLHNPPQSISSPGKPLASHHHFNHFLPDDNDTTFPEKADSALASVISNVPLTATVEEVGGATVARSKRDRPSWKDLQGFWGKRDNEARPAWNNYKGSWGKKADWSSLRGSWGKRASDMKGGWSGLRGSWGKRAEDDQQGAVEPDLPTDLSKRAGWSSLQGSWGKRGEGLEAIPKRAGWSSLQGSWGKRNSLEGESSLPHVRPSEEEEDSEETSSRQYQRHFRDDEEEDLFMQELASLLARSYEQKRLLRQGNSPELLSYAGISGQQQDQEGGVEDEFVDRVGLPVAEGVQESSAQVDSGVSVEKRETPRQYVSAGWLKRPDGLLVSPRSTNWSSLRGSWGKRGGQSGWSQMRGTWGKRPDLEKWSSLRGSWGKRGGDASWSSLRGSWGKREPSNNWGSLRGSWGKRGSDDVSGEQTE